MNQKELKINERCVGIKAYAHIILSLMHVFKKVHGAFEIFMGKYFP